MCRDSKGWPRGPAPECRKHWDPGKPPAAAATCVLASAPSTVTGRSHRLEGWEGGALHPAPFDLPGLLLPQQDYPSVSMWVSSPYLHTAP